MEIGSFIITKTSMILMSEEPRVMSLAIEGYLMLRADSSNEILWKIGGDLGPMDYEEIDCFRGYAVVYGTLDCEVEEDGTVRLLRVDDDDLENYYMLSIASMNRVDKEISTLEEITRK